MRSNEKNAVKSARSKNGSAAMELCAGASILIAMTAFTLNVCIAMMSYGINERACRDAARAAAQGSTSAEAFQLANAIVKTYNSGNSLLTPVLVSNVSFNDFGGHPPDGISPFVTVTTSSVAKLPAPVEIFGNRVFGTNLSVRKQYTFPIVKLNVPL